MIIKLAPANKPGKSESHLDSYSHICCPDSTIKRSSSDTINKIDGTHIVKEKKKITRTKTGCLCCRRRKKKCDEQKPACSGCLRNNLQCIYPTEAVIKQKSTSSRKSKKIVNCYNAYPTTEIKPVYVPSSPSQPLLASPDSANSSDSESPLTSPKLQPFSLNMPAGTVDGKVPFLSINTIDYKAGLLKNFETKATKHISVKSLLN